MLRRCVVVAQRERGERPEGHAGAHLGEIRRRGDAPGGTNDTRAGLSTTAQRRVTPKCLKAGGGRDAQAACHTE